MEGVGHVNVQEDLESHGLFNLVLYPWYVGLGLEYVGVEPYVVSAEPNKRFGRLGCDHQRRSPRRSGMSLHIGCETVDLFLRMFVQSWVNRPRPDLVKRREVFFDLKIQR